VFVYPKITVLG